VKLARCQRYYYVHVNGSGQHVSLGALYNPTYLVAEVRFPVEMRSVPSLIEGTGTNYYRFYRDDSSDDFNNWSDGISRATKVSTNLETSLNISGTAGYGGIIEAINSASLIAFSSEL